MAIFARSAKTRIFWKSAKAESKEIFQTSLKKYPLVERLKSTVAQKALSCMQNADKFQRREDFGANSGSRSARMAKLWKFSQGHPKPAISEKVERGDKGIFLKIRPKSSRRLKAHKHSGENIIILYLICT